MENNNEEKVEHADFETAILHTGFGRFQWLLLCACGGVYATCAVSTTTLSFVLPAAECDFLLTSSDKGRMSATPLIGMVFGSYFWGSLADTRGRKWVIISSLLMDALAAFLSSTVQSFDWFLVFRFFNGFGIIGATSIIFSYLGEFMSYINRDAMLSRLEVFWNFGIILLPGIAWLVIPQPWQISVKTWNGDIFIYHSWRAFVALCALPSLLAAIALSLLPESPRYLIAKGDHKKAREVLQKVYSINTGREMYEYPVTHLHGEIFCHQNGSLKKLFIPWYKRLLQQGKEIWMRNKEIFSPPHLKHLVITCFADFGLMSSYYTLMMWFPELFDRFDMYQWLNPGASAGICDVAAVAAPLDEFEIKIQNCSRPIDHKVFLYTIIIGISCLPSSISLGYLIDKLGKKYLIICSLVASGASVLGLNWVHSTLDTLALSCLFEALTSTAEAVIFCVVVDLFPTSLRAIALALTVTSGRLGAILGNVIFGWLVDLNCGVPIYTFGMLLISSGIFCSILPRGGHDVVLH